MQLGFQFYFFPFVWISISKEIVKTMNREANNTRHPLKESPNNTVVDTAPKTETSNSLAESETRKHGGNLTGRVA